ncbi:MAG: DUF4160 domain-containing protein [Candidatus Kapabacteria bacterium]|nr:DUF4160 domain-containing protein [Ignavibacteriota bacterium]MCW5886251.1 DUF4160 domain-containing protein [Candidatus Kapabacteria bacterium]
MPTISMFYGISIMMFYDEHNPPHFHAKYNEFKASIRISDLALMNGSLPPKALGLVVEWASLHQDELLQNWENAQIGNKLLNIKAL